MRFLTLLLACLFIGNSAAFDIEDFSNNLATDLGPLLSLFGDSMTKQFLGESISFLDYIIFAVAPIGIITAITSTIRLCGSTALRAFIGRSQEGQGAVEAELCTSTSRDVCELFTLGGIQRVLGRPSILELVYVPKSQETRTTADGKSRAGPELLLSKEYFSKHARLADSPWQEMGAKARTTMLAPNPNLSLNIGIRRPPAWALWATAILGIVLQSGVTVLAGIGVWRLGWSLESGNQTALRDYAPSMFIVGTVLLCAGMWGCAYLIGQTTQEVSFHRKEYGKKTDQPRLLWIQPGPQVIGDQSFDPFAYLEGDNAINVWLSSRKMPGKRFEWYTYAAVIVTFVGYIMQFIGLRGMKAWVSIAQLVITLIMSSLRGVLRTQRLANHDNQLSLIPDIVAGHELDWLAYRLASNEDTAGWHATAQHGRAVETHRNSKEDPKQMPATATELSNGSSHPQQSDGQMITGRKKSCANTEGRILLIRTRLANLTGLYSSPHDGLGLSQEWKDEHVKVRSKARQLSSVFETSSIVHRTGERARDIDLHVFATVLDGSRCKAEPVILTLKAPPEFSQAGWRFDAAQLEAVLGLWTWTMLAKHSRSEDSFEDELAMSSSPLLRNIQAARMVSYGLDTSEWHRQYDIQEQMDLWLGRSSVQFRQGMMSIDPSQPHGFATTFLGDVKEPNTFRVGHVSRSEQTGRYQQRFCGWTLAHQAMRATPSLTPPPISNPGKTDIDNSTLGTCRFQYVQLPTDVLILDLCCQELFVAMMMSLVDSERLEPPTFVESSNPLRLEHPKVSELAEAFVKAGLGTYSDALLCIVPALQRSMTALKLDTILPVLDVASQTHRRNSEWKRAEALLRFGCSSSEKQGVERGFGLDGIDWVASKFTRAAKVNPQVAEVVDCYVEIARRFRDDDANEGERHEDEPTKGTPSKIRTLTNTRDPGLLSHADEINKQLLQALQRYDRVEVLYQLCLLTPKPGVRTSAPPSALAVAARNDWPEVMSILLEFNASPNDADAAGKRAIDYCADLGHEVCARMLLDHNASLRSTVSQDGESCMLLHTAAQNGHAGIINLILERGSVDINQVDKRTYTPLMVAAEEGQTEIVRILLSTPGIIIERPGLSDTPLLCASKKGHVDIMKLLLDSSDLDLEKSGPYNHTPLLSAIANGHEEAAMLLMSSGAKIGGIHDKNRSLELAIQTRNVNIFQELMKRGMDINRSGPWDETPLMSAAAMLTDAADVQDHSQEAQELRERLVRSKTIFELLIKNKASLNAEDFRGMTVLAQAAKKNLTTVAQIALDNGAEKESKDKKGCTPLVQAVKAGARDMILLLLDAKANIEAEDKEGQTPLFHALSSCKMIDVLVDRGADLEARDKRNRTVLLKAQEDLQENSQENSQEKSQEKSQESNNRLDALKLLMQKGANSKIIGANGLSVEVWLKQQGEIASQSQLPEDYQVAGVDM